MFFVQFLCRSSCVCVPRCALVCVCMCVYLCITRFLVCACAYVCPSTYLAVCMGSMATGILCSKLPICVCSAVWTLVHSYMGLLAAMYSCGMCLYILLIISLYTGLYMCACVCVFVRACVCVHAAVCF